jgi:hypothetical protein
LFNGIISKGLVFHIDTAIRLHQGEVFHGILELPYIPRPWKFVQEFLSTFAEAVESFSLPRIHAADKTVGKGKDIVFSFSEGGDMNTPHADSVIEIQTEAFL